LTLDRRNELLMQLRESTIGATLYGFVRCPVCAAPLEFSATVREFLERTAAPAESCSIVHDGQTIVYRLPDTRDLAAAAVYLDLPEASATLFKRSAVSDMIGWTEENKAQIAAAIAEDLADRHPLVDIRIPLRCASDDHVWSASLDIASFLWTEVDRLARRLLDEVQALARAYGWPEADILAMSDSRRRFYLGALDA
jgi:hypothetical protein